MCAAKLDIEKRILITRQKYLFEVRIWNTTSADILNHLLLIAPRASQLKMARLPRCLAGPGAASLGAATTTRVWLDSPLTHFFYQVKLTCHTSVEKNM